MGERGEAGSVDVLRHVERVLYGRIGVGVAIYVVFVVLHVSAALVGQLSERSVVLLVLLVVAIFALPRQVLRPGDVERVKARADGAWMERMRRVQRWLVWVRMGFFLVALFLFMVLPELL